MEFYLVQHGEAAHETADPERALTARGRAEVERVARAAAAAGIAVPVIFHSGKLRARQTAEILASHLVVTAGVRESGSLAPNDDPADAVRLAEDANEPTMIVGHLPHLGRVASLLLAGNADREIIAFRMGAIVCLTGEKGAWRLRWMLTPEIAGA